MCLIGLSGIDRPQIIDDAEWLISFTQIYDWKFVRVIGSWELLLSLDASRGSYLG